MHDYFRMSQTEEFIKALKLEPEFTKGNSPYVKSKASRGENAGTWLSPIMFIDFAMWLNPAFKVKVLKFVQDEMIRFRNLAGDAYGYGMGYHYSTFSGWGNYVGDQNINLIRVITPIIEHSL